MFDWTPTSAQQLRQLLVQPTAIGFDDLRGAGFNFGEFEGDSPDVHVQVGGHRATFIAPHLG